MSHKLRFIFVFFLVVASTLPIAFLQKAQAANTQLSIIVLLHGIGKGGDNANANSGGNTSPKSLQKNISVGVFNAQNALVASKLVVGTYEATSGSYKATVDVGSLASGPYNVAVRSDKYLQKTVSGIQNIKAGQNNTIPPVTLIVGDIVVDNVINIQDYNLLMSCYADLSPAKACTPTQGALADITDDGSVNQLDYNLFIREISNRSGEGSTVPTSGVTPTTTAQSTTITNLPPQPGAIAYGDPLNTAAFQAYKKPGALVIPGRATYDQQAVKDVSASGGTVLIYLDVVIDASYGRYHTMLLKSSECGPAVPLWPGNPKANQWGNLNDFRVGGVLQGKLECVLEKMVAENPHMGGWFADDIGSRSWYPDINWDSWSTADKQAYRDGAIALTKTFRKVADKHGLIFLVNGTWGAGSLATNGGGYPDMNQSGNALADGGTVEHHATSELSYFKSYACSTQWAAQSPVTKGKAFNLLIASSDSERNAYAATNCFAYLTTQTEANYGQPPTPWGAFHATGLPNKVIQ